MNKEEAELEIRRLVGDIDAMRLSDESPTSKTLYIHNCNEAIARMKKITGPRNIVGTAHMIMPLPDVKMTSRTVDFEEWKRENKSK